VTALFLQQARPSDSRRMTGASFAMHGNRNPQDLENGFAYFLFFRMTE
jgi:hypothetical protein